MSDACWDYCNGGCSFKLMPGNDCASGDGVTVLARCKQIIGYTACCICLINAWKLHALETSVPSPKEKCDIAMNTHARCGLSSGKTARCKSGGCLKRLFARRYNAAAEGAVSALAVQAGKGRAVLTGTHPELHPDWLAGAERAEELVATGMHCLLQSFLHPCQQCPVFARFIENTSALMILSWGTTAGCSSPIEAECMAAKAAEVRQRLLSSQAGRTRFWRLLVAAAGLQQHLLPAVPHTSSAR
jgi:hypothetical protein